LHTQRQLQVGGCGRGLQQGWQGLGGGQQGCAIERLPSILTPQQIVFATPPRMQLTPWQMSFSPLLQRHGRRPQQQPGTSIIWGNPPSVFNGLKAQNAAGLWLGGRVHPIICFRLETGYRLYARLWLQSKMTFNPDS